MKNKKLIVVISSIIITILVLCFIIFFVYKNNGANSGHIKSFFVLFFAPYCKTCHEFMPIFKNLSKDYVKTYNFAALNIDDPQNYPIVAGNVGGIPSLYIFDSEIGNKVHISLSGIRNYNQLKEELDRYLRIRSFIDIDKAKAEHQKLMQAYFEEIQKNTKKEYLK